MRAVVIFLILFLVLPVYAEPGEAEMKAGMEFFYQGRWNDAIAHFRQALLEDPNTGLALFRTALTSRTSFLQKL